MAINVFDLMATLGLDTSKYDEGLNKAKTSGLDLGSGLATAAKVGIAAVGAATTATVAFGTASVKTGAEFDKSISQVAATMGKTVDEMTQETGKATLTFNGQTQEWSGNLREFAQVMGANTAFSASQAADALNYMALAGYKTQDSMNMLPNVLNLAAAGNMDLARASDMVTDTQTAFGLKIEEMPQLVDEMAKAASTGNTSVEQLGDAFLVVGGLAQELNGGMVTLADGTQKPVSGIQEMEIALTAMANAGIKGGEAGTHMRNMLLKLSDPTDEGAKTFDRLGVSVFDSTGKMRSLNEIFGDLSNVMNGDVTPAVAAFYDRFKGMSEENILKEFKKAPEDFEIFGMSIVDDTGHLKEFDAVMAEANEKLKDGIDQQSKLQAIGNIFNTRDIASSEALLGAVEGTVVKIGDEVYSMGTAYEKFGDAIYDSSQGFEIVQSSWDGIGESILNAEGAAQKMADTQLDNLEGDITKFKAALEGAQIIISDGLTPTLREFVQFGTEGISTLSEAFKEDGLSGVMEALGTVLSDGLNKIIEELPKVVDAGMKLLGALGQGLLDNLPVIIDAAVQIVNELLTSLLQAAPSLLEGALQILVQLATGLGELAPTIIPDAVNAIIDTILSILENVDALVDGAIALVIGLTDGIMNALPILMERLPEIIIKLVEALVLNAPKLAGAGPQLILALIQGIIGALPDFLMLGPRLVTGLLEALVNDAPKMAEGGISQMQNLIEGIVGMIPNLLLLPAEIVMELVETFANAAPNLIESGQALVEAVGEGISNLIDNAVQWGADLIDSFVSGIMDNVDRVISAAEDVASSVQDIIGFSEPKKGPLSDFHTYAPDMMKLFAQGIKDNTDIVTDQIEKSFDFDNILAGQQISMGADYASSTGFSSGNIVQNLTINSPTALDPSEIARQTKNANREFVLKMRMA